MNQDLDYMKLVNQLKKDESTRTLITYSAELKILDRFLSSKALKSFDDLICNINEKIFESLYSNDLNKASDLASICNDVIDNYSDYFIAGISFD